jgi:hypothetical protein
VRSGSAAEPFDEKASRNVAIDAAVSVGDNILDGVPTAAPR